MTARRLRRIVALGVGLSLLVAGWFFAVSWGASGIAVAPNFGRPAPPAQPGELRVDVGPPPANLSLEIIDAPDARATLFILHGIRDKKASFHGLARDFAASGYRVVLVDSRGHGRSSGDWLTYGVQEARDLSQVLDALVAQKRLAGKPVALGFSYGAATALMWAGSEPRLAAAVAVAPFQSLDEVVPGYAPWWAPRFLLRAAIAKAGRMGGFDPDQANALKALEKATAPILIMHGLDDHHIAFRHSENLAKTGKAQLELLPNEDHISVLGDQRGVVRTKARAFFDQALSIR